jgi:hypothetical protein
MEWKGIRFGILEWVKICDIWDMGTVWDFSIILSAISGSSFFFCHGILLAVLFSSHYTFFSGFHFFVLFYSYFYFLFILSYCTW